MPAEQVDPELAAYTTPEGVMSLDAARARRDRLLERTRQAGEMRALVEAEDLKAIREGMSLPLARWEETGTNIRERFCSRCTGPDSPSADSCGRRFEDAPVGGMPLCRWVDQRAAYEREQSRIARRRLNLQQAGITNPEIIRVVGQARAPHDALPVLPAEWSPSRRDTVLREPRRVADAAARWLAGNHRGHLYLFGSTGTWKTWGASSIVAEVPGALWLPMSKVFPGPHWSETSARAISAPLVVLSDLGTEYTQPSGWNRNELALIMTERDDARLPTHITTNLTLDQFGAAYGDRARDRICRGELLECAGVSLREALRGLNP